MFDALSPFWFFVTRFGEAQILLPMTLAMSLVLARRGAPTRLVLGWLVWIAVVAGVTTVSKLAFIGWGVGNARLDFTGVSGHAMFAAAIYPVLFRLLPGNATRQAALWRAFALAAGVMLALLIAVSRVMVDAHSWSEVIAGHVLGLSASALTLRLDSETRRDRSPTPRWVPVALAAWMLVLTQAAPPSNTHGLVTRLALSLSGRETPYHRSDLQRRAARSSAPTLQQAAATADPHSPAHHSGRPDALRGGFRRS